MFDTNPADPATTSTPTPPPVAKPDPWTTDEYGAATKGFTDFLNTGGRSSWGQPEDALSVYRTNRNNGQSHDQAFNSARDYMGWTGASLGSAAPQSTAPTTPVTATGGIPPPQPTTPVAAPAAVPQAAPQAVGARPDARTPANVAASPTYTAQSFQNTLGAAPSINQFAAPDQSGLNGQQSALLNAIMAHPETMDANTIAQLKEQQKEQALLLGQQNASSFAQGAVGRGTLGNGRTDAFRQDNNQTINNSILSGNRAVDLAAIAQNRQDQLNALNASSAIGQDQLGRATSAYGTGLQGQLAQDNTNVAHAQFGFGIDQANANQQQLQYASQKDANDAAYARAMGLAQNAQSVYGQDLGAQFGNQAAGLDVAKFLENQSQFSRNLANNQSQFGANLGLGYDTLATNASGEQNNQLIALLRSYGLIQ